jgi:Heparinase II/III-like protein/Heparinase II/III N-terminus
MASLRQHLDGLRRTPPRRVPGKLVRLAARSVRSRRLRRYTTRRGELSDAAFLRALGGRFGSVDEVVAHVRGRTRPRFFVDATQARERARQLAAAYPRLARRTLAAAERVLCHEVDLLGSGPVRLGATIDWHTDFKVGYTWPNDVFAADIETLLLDHPCDIKVPWELNRCHHWVTLGRAYAHEPDPRLAREFVAQLDGWLVANPWPCGVNWDRAMEAAVRAVNWLWAAALFDAAPEFDTALRGRLLKSLLQHGRHILANLEYSDNNGNHYLSNGVGLLYLGVLLPELREAAAWRAKGSEIVWGELARQVRPDGVDFEQAIGYHGLVLEFWYSCVALCELNGVPVPALTRDRLGRMFDFTLAYTRPDGTFPQIGDNDDGRLAGLDDEPVGDHRRHLAVGGVLLDRPDLLGAAGDAVETALWLLGPAVLSAPRATPQPGSRAFPDGGFYVLRDRDAVMVVDAGEVGMNGIGGHGHNDMLSFDLWAGGGPLLADSGTYTYSADARARQLFRATAAHNTVRVDETEIARLGQGAWLWRIEDDAHPLVHTWRSDAEHDLLDAEHDGYARLGVRHRRRVLFDKRRRTWRIQDLVVGTGEHLVESFLHPAVPIEEVDGLRVRLRAAHGDWWIEQAEPPTGLRLERRPGWLSRAYGHRAPATVLVYVVRTALPVTLTTLIFPREGG